MPLAELDAYARQQAYLEGYKEGEAQKADTLIEEAGALLLVLLARTGYATLSEMPKRLLRKVIADLNKQLARKFAAFEKVTAAQMEKFMRVAVTINRNIAKSIRGAAAPAVDNKALWAATRNAPIPGSGLTASKMLSDYAAAATREINRTLTRAYADGMTPQELSRAFFGTKANGFRDGLARKLRNQYGATIETLIQHIQQSVIHTVGRLVTDQYQWVSVIDGRTTDICLGRNGNIYEYASGPRPPAHYRCRSTIQPIYGEVPGTPPTFYAWVKAQPPAIQNDLVGRQRAVALRSGKLKAEDLPRFQNTRALTLEQYANTNDKINQA